MYKKKNEKAVILVTSCYEYRDVLLGFEHFFKKRWIDCPFEVWLITDKKIDTDFNYDKIIVSNKHGSLNRMRDIQFDTPYVILMQEDHWLIDTVYTNEILTYIELAEKYNCGNLRLLQDPPAYDDFSEKENLMEYKPGKAYRISVRGGIWETEYFETFIQKFTDLWEMERLGQELSNCIDKKVLCCKNRILPIVDAVNKGKLTDFAYAMLDAARLPIKRKVMSPKDQLISNLKGSILNINPEVVTKIQSILNIGHKHKY